MTTMRAVCGGVEPLERLGDGKRAEAGAALVRRVHHHLADDGELLSRAAAYGRRHRHLVAEVEPQLFQGETTDSQLERADRLATSR